MTRIALFAGAASIALLPLTATAAEDAVITSPEAIKWSAAPPALPKGAEIAVLYGDPTKDGPYALRLKFPAGFKVPPHMHPVDENVTVISGVLRFGMGDSPDPKTAHELKPGSFIHMPKGMHHYGWTTTGAVVQLNGTGPFAVTYINPADDPRKTN